MESRIISDGHSSNGCEHSADDPAGDGPDDDERSQTGRGAGDAGSGDHLPGTAADAVEHGTTQEAGDDEEQPERDAGSE